MPKSKNRKGQKQKSRQRSLVEKNKKVKARKELMQIFQNAQKEAMEKQQVEKQEETNVVGAEQLGDIGSDLTIE